MMYKPLLVNHVRNVDKIDYPFPIRQYYKNGDSIGLHGEIVLAIFLN